ncbi:gastrula zinc finger protein XlCGF7.1-like isoform X2 [Neoarius graeffei]|uniref:gastrula zinc finger protein XlCGF7.1-like isoform X2 n=1 Tax=Neoarius graeffei TaxID=443677 RepID=UPI00298C4385|nr:gastrula zinc finger protein XlCGF7.1-like isoform X2 [Neoarius graeffei]
MNNLDSLNTFLTERLMTVAGEIFQVFKEAFSEYQGEIERIKQENRCLREALAEIYNSVQERAEKHSLNQRALNTDSSLIQVNLELETRPKKSDPHQSQSHPHTCTSKLANTARDLDPNSSFSEKTELKDENEDSTNITVKVEPCASQAVFCPEANQARDQQEPLSCTYCDQMFTEISQLASHVQSHMALYTCAVCGKAFKQKGTLKTHMIVHQKERPFGCGYCKKRFKLKSHLKEHERIHTGEKPFSCPVCRMCFTRSNPMKIHLRNHHQEQLQVNQ